MGSEVRQLTKSLLTRPSRATGTRGMQLGLRAAIRVDMTAIIYVVVIGWVAKQAN